MNVSCVINAHQEAHTIQPTIVSVRRAVDFARSCGLEVDVHAILDRSDSRTKDIVYRELQGFGQVHYADFGDLASSRNFGVEQSDADYIAFIDGDDLWSRRWLVDSYLMATADSRSLVLHPEFNIYFGAASSHVFQHVDMEDRDFEPALMLRKNYWTALSFARREIYRDHPYRANRLETGFGYEDWTWNYETVNAGLVHKIVPGSSHFIRKVKSRASLLEKTDSLGALPRVLDLYRTIEQAEGLQACPESSLHK